MAKISDTASYPNITSIDLADYLIITDEENNLMTKSCTIQTLTDFSIARGIVKLISPDGSVWQLFVSNAGVITTQAVI
jgi:hypothetical protein